MVCNLLFHTLFYIRWVTVRPDSRVTLDTEADKSQSQFGNKLRKFFQASAGKAGKTKRL